MILHKILTNHQRLHNSTSSMTTYKSLTSNVLDDDKFVAVVSRICDATLQKMASNNKACESCEKTKCFLCLFCFVSLILSFFLALFSIFVLRGDYGKKYEKKIQNINNSKHSKWKHVLRGKCPVRYILICCVRECDLVTLFCLLLVFSSLLHTPIHTHRSVWTEKAVFVMLRML